LHRSAEMKANALARSRGRAGVAVPILFKQPRAECVYAIGASWVRDARRSREPSSLLLIPPTLVGQTSEARSWGGWPKASRVGGCSRRTASTRSAESAPTRHIVRKAHDVLSLPTEGRGRDKARVSSTHTSRINRVSPLWRAKLPLSSLPLLWGGWRESAGWGVGSRGTASSRSAESVPTRHMVRKAHDVLSLPTEDRGRDEDRRCGCTLRNDRAKSS
jgi:hypothetical protein